MDTQINKIAQELTTNALDLRAEVFISEILKKKNIDIDSILIANEGAFKRAYSNDVVTISTTETKNKNEFLKLTTSRNSIYDTLPSGIFHDVLEDTTINYTESFKKRIEEEKAARLLFSPIENELFHQRVILEQKNEEISIDFGNLNDDFLIDLWKIDKTIPKKYSVRLVKLLPYTHKIAGDLEQTFSCLEKLLDTTVHYKKQFKARKTGMETTDSNSLGLDFVLHQDVVEILQPHLEVEIELSEKGTIKDFLGKKDVLKFVKLFYKYFIPFEYEISTKIALNSSDGFILNRKEDDNYMGITTRL